MKRLILVLSLFIFAADGVAQDSTAMSFESFSKLVKQYHPVIRQARMLDEMAQAELLGARAALDPKISSAFDEKTFNDKKYYSSWETTLKVPLWWGIDLKAGWETNTGLYVNPETATPNAGMALAGISVPLAQGIIIDQRRNTIRQAQLIPQLAGAEKQKAIIKQEMQAAKDYWEWAFQQQRYEWMKTSYKLSADRFTAVKARALLGELPSIDTVEALVAMQDRETQLIAARIDYKNALIQASLHLWNEKGEPLDADTNLRAILPASIDKNFTAADFEKIRQAADTAHPELIKIDTKLQQLAIENRFATDKLKPKIYFDYNFLTESFPGDAALNNNYISGNYKIGLRFSYSLFLREERAKIQLTRIKIRQTDLDQDFMQRSIRNSVDATYNELVNLRSQIDVQEKQVVATLQLRDGEQVRFANGESSFFLVNTRELGLISSNIKLAELRAKYAKTMANIRWSAGMSPMQ